MSMKNRKVWVRDPTLSESDVFVQGTVIAEDAMQVRPAGAAVQPPDQTPCSRARVAACAADR